MATIVPAAERGCKLVNKRRIFKLCTLFLGVSLLALSLSACESRKNTRGNLLDPERVIEIRPGEQSREEVAEILGSPSSVTPFGGDTWYYISQRIETFAFFVPRVIERQIVVVSFDKKGMVAKVDTLARNYSNGCWAGETILRARRNWPTSAGRFLAMGQPMTSNTARTVARFFGCEGGGGPTLPKL